MSGVVECVLCVGCTTWLWKRCTYIGAYDSESWPPASPEELAPVPRLCRLILANYEDDIQHPKLQPCDDSSKKADDAKDASGAGADQRHQQQPSTVDPLYFKFNPDWVIKRVTYSDEKGHCPPYLIYADHDNKELVLAIRGLNLIKESDYKLLLDNRLGRQMFDGGYVHHGLLKAATWLLNREATTLRDTWLKLGPDYKLVFTGHSLGSGVAALIAVLVVNNLDKFGGIPRSQVRCYAIAPARCMSLNLAVKYADVIQSVVLQDDFLPRTATPLQHIFGSIFCLPCLMFFVCLRDTFIPEHKKLSDPRRLYAPGRMYHIVERRFCRCGRFPPEVRTAVPVEGRFEHIVLSCNATKDHAIVWIEKEARKAVEYMNHKALEDSVGAGGASCPPPKQKMDRMQTMKKEHQDALERVSTFKLPEDDDEVEHESTGQNVGVQPDGGEPQHADGGSWDELVQKLFNSNESGKVVLKKDFQAIN